MTVAAARADIERQKGFDRDYESSPGVLAARMAAVVGAQEVLAADELVTREPQADGGLAASRPKRLLPRPIMRLRNQPRFLDALARAD